MLLELGLQLVAVASVGFGREEFARSFNVNIDLVDHGCKRVVINTSLRVCELHQVRTRVHDKGVGLGSLSPVSANLILEPIGFSSVRTHLPFQLRLESITFVG